MKESICNDSGIDSPGHDSLKNIDSCYSNSFMKHASFANSRRALQSGAQKISRTLRSVKNTFGNLSRHLRIGSRHRHRLSETLTPCRQPATPVNKKQPVRGPARLYSPFGLDTPPRAANMTPYMPDTPEHQISPKRRKGAWHLLAKKRPRALFN